MKRSVISKKLLFITLIIWIFCICISYANFLPVEYEGFNGENRVVRIEPEGEGTIFKVNFLLNNRFIGDTYMLKEGQGIGIDQWPYDPIREGYSFEGWYDNDERIGESYTINTPIYKDTNLYAKWIYCGYGGCWPRPYRGKIQGLEDGMTVKNNQNILIVADGYNMNLGIPKDERFRWLPIKYRISDNVNGDFPSTIPFQAGFSINTNGEYTLYITYMEEIFDGVGWQKTGQEHEVEELSFKVK